MKLFVTDIDDTLSVGEVVPEEVKQSCLRLVNSGWDVMVATGRSFGTAKNHIRDASATQPAILCDGSRFMSLDGKEIRSSLLNISDIHKLLGAIWNMPLEIQITSDEIIYCRESDKETARFYSQAGVPVRFIKNVENIENLSTAPVYRVGLWMNPEKLLAAESEIRKLFGDIFEITTGGICFLDILPKGVSKGNTLSHFISGLPERPEIIVAAGDHNNDLTMLKFADFAAAPRNAAPAVLSTADFIMPRADEHGICSLVDHILSSEFGGRCS